MKIQKMNKEKFKNWTIFLFFLVVSVLNSCSNFLSFDENRTDENKTAAQDDKCIITVSSDFYSNDGSRAAFPDFLLSPDTLYFAEISYTSGSSKKWLGEDSVSETAVVLKNNYSDVIRFVFCAPQETSSYTLALYACPKQTGNQVSAVKKSAFAQGDAAFELSAGQKVLSSTLNIKLRLQESSGKGKVDLPLSFDSVLGILAAKVNVTKDGVSDSGENNYGFKIEVSGNSARLSAENASAGTYLAIMKFYNSMTDFSSSAEVAVNSAVQHISVYSEMTTNLWFIGGKKHGTTEADGTFTPSALELTKYDFTELYVCGTDGGGESDGKRSFYVSSNFGSSVPDASDTTGDGSMAKPFATVQKAVDTIAAFGDTSKKYTIYVDGTVTAYSSDDFKEDSATSDKSFIYISTQNSITIKGFSKDSKAVLNANQKDGNQNGNVLTVNASNANITLENLTVTGGSRNATGGGIYAIGSLTLKNCTVTKNKSNNAGGGISFSGKELVLENTSVTYNESSGTGGGMDADGKVTISGSKILNNSANYGGGIYFSSNKNLDIKNKTIINNNSAIDTGGGLYLLDGKTIIKDSSLLENKANYGGAIYTASDLDLIEKVAIKKNFATTGGGAICGMYRENNGTQFQIKIGENTSSSEIEICENSTEGNGGAIYCSDYANFIMNAGVISENFCETKAVSLAKYGGGAVYLFCGPYADCSFKIFGGIISDNKAQNGGAFFISSIGSDDTLFYMQNGLLKGNKAINPYDGDKGYGGAIYCTENNTIKLNLSGIAVIAVEDDGNDIYILDGKKITVTGTLTPENNAAAGNPKYTARITPQNYTLEKTIIQGEGELDGSSCTKFLVTANAADELKYKIKYDSSSKTGKLATTQNIVINGMEYEKTALEDVIDTATTITGDGSSKVFDSGRKVTLSPYSIGKYEVTQELYEAVMGVNPSKFQGDTKPPADEETQELRPVEGIYWYHAILFCNKLSIKMGLNKCYIITQSDGSEIDYDNIDLDNNNIKAVAPTWQILYKFENNGYRLPTEAEWEFAARGGDQSAVDWNYTYAGSDDIEYVAWYNEDGVRGTKISHEVGKKNYNSLGLYDMSGNCWEFCSDRADSVSTGEVTDPVASGTGCIRRGGGFYDENKFINILNIFNRSFQSESDLTTWDYADNGFRLVRRGF